MWLRSYKPPAPRQARLDSTKWLFRHAILQNPWSRYSDASALSCYTGRLALRANHGTRITWHRGHIPANAADGPDVPANSALINFFRPFIASLHIDCADSVRQSTTFELCLPQKEVDLLNNRNKQKGADSLIRLFFARSQYKWRGDERWN